MTKRIRHVAGPYTDGVQQCTRCLRILLDNRGGMSRDGSPPPKYAEGAVLVHGGGCMSLGDRSEAVDCDPMEVR